MTKTSEGQGAEVQGQIVDTLLLDLGRALEASPSSDFGIKVRARISNTTAPASSAWSWRWGFLAGAIAAVVLLGVLVRLRSDRPAAPAAGVQASSPVLAPAVLAPMVLAPAVPVPNPSVASAGAPAVTTTISPRRARAMPATRVSPDIPQVLIAPDQASAVRSLMNRFASGRVPSTSLASDANESSLLQIEELAPIPLIVIPPLAAPPNTGGAGSSK